MPDAKQKLIIIGGPTATGKSAIAVELALYFGGEIINADSLQVYRGLDIGTAKPSMAERQGVPHHLLDVVEPDEEFNAALYRQTAFSLIEEMAARKKAVFIAGGTGLYIKALLGGLVSCPPSDPELRRALQQEWEVKGPAVLYDRLKQWDKPAAEKIHTQDRVRIIRALEVITLTGSPFSVLIQGHGFSEKAFQTLKIGLHLKRDHLYDRINQRCLGMIEKGLLLETQGLLNQGYAPELKPLQSIGYRHMIQYLQGLLNWDQAIHDFQVDTRHYAKRQMTWFGRDPEMTWLDPVDKDPIFKMVEGFLLSP